MGNTIRDNGYDFIRFNGWLRMHDSGHERENVINETISIPSLIESLQNQGEDPGRRQGQLRI